MKQTSTRARGARRQQWLQQIDSVMRNYGLEPASRLALQALAEGVEHPALLNLAASSRYAEGRFDEAARLLKRARALAPKDPNILNSLGASLDALGQSDAALEAYNAALRVDPHMAPAHYNRGAVLESLNEIQRARSAYETASNLDPKYLEPLASLAWLDAQRGDTASARLHAERALALSGSDVISRMALAFANLQSGDLEAAAALLSALRDDQALTRVNRSIVFGLIGDLKDAQRDSTQAFAAYQASNNELKALKAPQFAAPGTETALTQVQRLIAWFGTADPRPWQDAPPQRPRAGDPKAHVFLVGFPRSGTTLLENVLVAHPEVVSLEEKDCLAAASDIYLASTQGIERLARISPADAVRERERYWSSVRSFGVEPRGRVFIDKFPLASTALPLIAKLFPGARVLFARRDPRDVVLSCFRRRFGMNASMYQLLTLEGAAAHYDAVMRLSELYRELLPLPQHIVRYESLVEDFEGTARAACSFLGIEWDEQMADFAARARTRGISTPSAAQVARGLNREGQGAWRRYAEQMAPVLPLLQPWVERFGYEP